MKVVLTYLEDDSHGRPVYVDEKGKLWKDIDNREKWLGPLYSAYRNSLDGEPDCPMRGDVECEFIPHRVVRS